MPYDRKSGGTKKTTKTNDNPRSAKEKARHDRTAKNQKMGSTDFPRLEDLIGKKGAEDAEKIGKSTLRVLYTLGDMLTGGGVTETFKVFDPNTFNRAEKLGLDVATLEALQAALQGDLNDLQNKLANLSDPSLYMDTYVKDSLSSLGFVNSKELVSKLKDSFDIRSKNRSKEIVAAHDKFLKEQESVRKSIAQKSSEIAEKTKEVEEARQKYENELNKSNAEKVIQ